MPEIAGLNVRGPVRTCRHELSEWDEDHQVWKPSFGLTIVTFRPDGQVIDGESHNPDGSINRWANAYDAEGRVVEERWWKDDEPTSTTVHAYDAEGRPAGQVTMAPDGTRRETEICIYDSPVARPRERSFPARHDGRWLRSRGESARAWRAWRDDYERRVMTNRVTRRRRFSRTRTTRSSGESHSQETRLAVCSTESVRVRGRAAVSRCPDRHRRCSIRGPGEDGDASGRGLREPDVLERRPMPTTRRAAWSSESRAWATSRKTALPSSITTATIRLKKSRNIAAEAPTWTTMA